jgi:hypothetical protein
MYTKGLFSFFVQLMKCFAMISLQIHSKIYQKFMNWISYRSLYHRNYLQILVEKFLVTFTWTFIIWIHNSQCLSFVLFKLRFLTKHILVS